MTMPNLKFTREEYAERLGETRRAMAAKGVDLLIVSDPSNMAWLTGYDGWSFYVHQAVLVPPDGEPVWYGRGQDANGARRDLSFQQLVDETMGTKLSRADLHIGRGRDGELFITSRQDGTIRTIVAN